MQPRILPILEVGGPGLPVVNRVINQVIIGLTKGSSKPTMLETLVFGPTLSRTIIPVTIPHAPSPGVLGHPCYWLNFRLLVLTLEACA